MKPSDKDEQVENDLMKVFGHDRRVHIKEETCVPAPIGCGMKVDFTDMDEIHKEEYRISGMCKTCQDSFFRA